MKVIVPMAGTGDRFVRAGYHDPKPLIEVNGKRIIDYILDMFDRENDEFEFICNARHLATTQMRDILEKSVTNGKIHQIDNHKKGPVFTVLDAGLKVDPEEEVVITYCDNPYLWDYKDFKAWPKGDGCVLSHTGFHPHRLSPTFMAHILENNLQMVAIKEKEPYTSTPMAEQASTGTYYFKKWGYVTKYFNELVARNINYNGEYYVTLVYNLMIEDGLLCTCYPTDHVTVFGTPEEVQNFEAWQTLINSTQVKNEDDLVRSYRYWKAYNGSKLQP